jgi:hypothetical protein
MPISGETINSTADQYKVTRLHKDNLGDLALLHTAVYGRSPAVDHFPGKYNTAYTGLEYVGFIAYNADKIPVAFYGVIPCFIEYNGEILLAAQSADTMTHPQHRFKGMFVELSNKTFDLCRELGIRLVFGFPNQNSYHGAVNKLGWKMTEAMAYFVINIQTIPLAFLSTKAGWLRRLYKSYSLFILKRKLLPEKGVANSAMTEGFAGICRSKEFLFYKTYSDSLVMGFAGAKVWASIKQGIWIGDMENVSDKNFNTVITSLKRTARWLGIKQIQFHCSPGTELYRLFAAHFTAAISYPVLFQDFGSSIPPGKIKFTFSDIDIF